MTMRLAGQVAIVTGAGMGIGKAIAERLAADGAAVVAADVRGHEATAAALRDAGSRAIAAAADVTSEADVAAMAEAALREFGRIDVLVNNAGIFSSLEPKPFEAIDPAEWRRVMDVNTLGIFLATRAVVPHMRARGAGRIVNIASGTPFKGVPFLLHYVGSKGAVVAITRALAKELGAAGILVNAVAPGFTLSDGVKANPAQLERLQEASVKARVIARDQFPADIVGAVSFFASADAAFITGQTLVVDGGAYFH
jgi:NAD(P)-dependent dehydrogenase (short-subunit alcohol dehydrogenase family)